jgi:hypothetical protein
MFLSFYVFSLSFLLLGLEFLFEKWCINAAKITDFSYSSFADWSLKQSKRSTLANTTSQHYTRQKTRCSELAACRSAPMEASRTAPTSCPLHIPLAAACASDTSTHRPR